MDQLEKKLRGYKYKNLTLLAISLAIAFALYQKETFHSMLLRLDEASYVGAFVAGILATSTFTVAIATLIFLVLAEAHPAILIGIIAGFGAVFGDLFIFRLLRGSLADELTILYMHIDHKNHLKKILRTKYFSWTLPVLGAIIIAIPFIPDELGVSLFGISRMKTRNFILVSFLLNTIGITVVIMASNFIKP